MIYETKKDRAGEAKAAYRVAEYCGLSYITTPTLADIDLLFFRGDRLRAVGEIKCRKEQYPEVFFEVAKWEKLRAISEMLHVKPLFIADFPGGTYVCDPSRLMPLEVQSVTRQNRAGEEPDDCYLVPVQHMTKVGDDS